MIVRETAFQAETFAAFLGAGLAAALLYDLLTPVFRSRSVAVHVSADFLLCVCTMILCFFALALTGRNALRGYMALALFMGAAVYRLGIHRLLTSLINLWTKNRKSSGDGE